MNQHSRLRPSRLLRLVAITAIGLGAALSSHGFMRIAGGELTLRASAEVTFGDRINGFRSSPSDTYYTFTTGLGYQRDTNGKIQFNATIDVPIVRFSSESQYNSNDIRFGLDVSRPYDAASKISFDWDLSYDDSLEVDYFVNDRVSRETLRGSLLAKYNLNLKTHLRSGFTYEESNSSYSDYESITYFGGVGINNLFFGRVGGYIDYQIYDRKRTGGIINDNVDDDDGSIVFGITGQILPERLFPKLEADLSFSTRSTNSIRSGKRDTTSINGRLSYPASPKTNISFNANRDLSITTDDRNVIQTSFILAASHSLRQNFTWNSSIGTTKSEYIEIDRNDDSFIVRTELSYRFVTPLTISGSILYRSNDSSEPISDFDSTSFTIRASYVY